MGRAKTILIIDDDAEFVAMVRALLTAAGYSVHTALTAQAGLKAAQGLAPDLIFLDATIGGEPDSYATLRQLRTLPGLSRTPVVLVSSVHTGDLPVFQVTPNGGWVPADLILPKPLDESRLLAEAARLTGG